MCLMMWMIFGPAGKTFSSRPLIIVPRVSLCAWKAITCRGSSRLLKNKFVLGIICMGNSADPRRVTTGTTIVFSEPRSQFWKDRRPKIFAPKLRLFSSRSSDGLIRKKTETALTNDPVTMQVKFVWLKRAQLLLTLVWFLIAYPTIDESNEFPSHISPKRLPPSPLYHWKKRFKYCWRVALSV